MSSETIFVYGTVVSIFSSRPSCNAFDAQHFQKYFEANFYAATVSEQYRCLEESGQERPNNLHRTPIVPDSGWLVLHKVYY